MGPRILVAEDHEKLRASVVAMLSSEFEVVGAVGNGAQLVQAALLLLPDAIVSDIRMPVKDGASARKEIRLNGIDRPFVFMTMIEASELSPFIAKEATGYVHKMDLSNELARAIQAVLLGNSYFSQTFQERFGSGKPPAQNS